MFCKYCGSKIMAAGKFCGSCGKAVNGISSAEVEPQRQSFVRSELTGEQKKFLEGKAVGAFLGIFWAFFSRAYWYIIIFLIPFLNVLAILYFIFMGRELVWEQGKWNNFDEYAKRQMLLDKCAKIVLGIFLGIGILGILSSIIITAMNPSQILSEARDANRISDLSTLKSALSLYWADVPDGKLCDGISSYRSDFGSDAVDGTGWLPVNFNNISGGSPIEKLPIDPINKGNSVYKLMCYNNGKSFTITSLLESEKYNSYMVTDDGYDQNRYEIKSSWEY